MNRVKRIVLCIQCPTNCRETILLAICKFITIQLIDKDFQKIMVHMQCTVRRELAITATDENASFHLHKELQKSTHILDISSRTARCRSRKSQKVSATLEC